MRANIEPYVNLVLKVDATHFHGFQRRTKRSGRHQIAIAPTFELNEIGTDVGRNDTLCDPALCFPKLQRYQAISRVERSIYMLGIALERIANNPTSLAMILIAFAECLDQNQSRGAYQRTAQSLTAFTIVA